MDSGRQPVGGDSADTSDRDGHSGTFSCAVDRVARSRVWWGIAHWGTGSLLPRQIYGPKRVRRRAGIDHRVEAHRMEHPAGHRGPIGWGWYFTRTGGVRE